MGFFSKCILFFWNDAKYIFFAKDIEVNTKNLFKYIRSRKPVGELWPLDDQGLKDMLRDDKDGKETK